MENGFTHLHVHTSYSFLDGYCKPDRLVGRAKDLGMDAIAITDHNHLGGTLEFQEECMKAGIKPILGLEAYYTWDMQKCSAPIEERNNDAAITALNENAISQEEYDVLTKKTKNSKIKITEVKNKIKQYSYDTKQYHILFLAMNQTGWSNLIKLQSEAAKSCCFNGRFLCDNNLIKKYNEGLIMTTACVANAVARLVNNQELDKAEKLLLEWHAIFQDRLYLEIQPLAIPIQVNVNKFYIEMSKKHNIKLVATNDVHYILRDDHDDHDTLLCIGTGTKKTDVERLRYSNDFWLRSKEEMLDAFKRQKNKFSDFLGEDYIKQCIIAMDNTQEINKRIEQSIKIGSDTPLIPQVHLPEGTTPENYLMLLCYKKLYELSETDDYVKEHLGEYEKRIKKELDVIIPKGFSSYLLVVDEMIKWANNNNCPTGPGRGSAAGSLCLYLMGITKNVDPMKYDLMFERFLSPDRVAYPDIDTDYSYTARDSVIKHLEDIYGNDCVAHIGTYTVMGVKSGLKDVGRVLSVNFDIMNAITKKLDEVLDTPQPKFKDYDELKNSDDINNQKKWKIFNELEEENEELFRLARAFEGLKRNFGVHASGVLAMPIPVTDIMPTRVAPDGTVVTLYSGTQVEDINAIKLDVLGLKTLSIIQDTLQHIDKNLTFDDLYKNVNQNLNDQKIFKMLSNKKTDCVFQLESDMFKGLVSQIQPESLDDITAITSLGRPGPLSAGMHEAYAKRKSGKEEVQTLLRGCEDIFGNTYGVLVYQEQTMLAGIRAFGFDAAQSDSLIRKIFAKKKKDKMEMLRRIMKYGKKNCSGPENWYDNDKLPWYDEKAEYGNEISGGLANGYSEKEVDDYWHATEGCASYLFNKSHAIAYSYITLMTAWLKYHYPTEFYAAVLSLTSDEDKRDKYIQIAESEGIKTLNPDINLSEISFTPNAEEKKILYGIGAIKGIGEAVIEELIKERPYSSLEKMIEKIPKKIFNKKVGLGLIKAGALDSFNENRYKLINLFHDLRKDKDTISFILEDYDENACIEMEIEALGVPIKYKPWWHTIEDGTNICETAEVISIEERVDKNKNLMCFAKLKINNCIIDTVIFSSIYCKSIGLFDNTFGNKIKIFGKKDGSKNKLIAKKISAA